MAGILERLQQASGPKTREVTIGGQEYLVRGMGPIQRAKFLQCMRAAAAEKGMVPDHVVVALGLCNAEAKSLTDEEQDLILELLREQDGKELHAAATAVLELSGFGAKSAEIAEKNP